MVLNPGHNGESASHPEEINRPVPNGRGGTKACNTTETATDGGYPEHAFNWDVALRVRNALTARGVQVVLTRPDDAGIGSCVKDRAAIANQAGAQALISIHADGRAVRTRFPRRLLQPSVKRQPGSTFACPGPNRGHGVARPRL